LSPEEARHLVVYHRRAGGQSQFSAQLVLEHKSAKSCPSLTIIIYVQNIFGLATKERSHPSIMETSQATAIAVGTRVTSRPCTDPYGPNSGIRLPPWVSDGEAPLWPRMKDSRLREPVVGQPPGPLLGRPVFLAPLP
jgi:hypothetical protein